MQPVRNRKRFLDNYSLHFVDTGSAVVVADFVDVADTGLVEKRYFHVENYYCYFGHFGY